MNHLREFWENKDNKTKMTKAIIIIGEEPGAAFTLAKGLKKNFKLRNIEGQARVDKQKRQVTIDADTNRKELEGILNSIELFNKLRPPIDYIEDPSAKREETDARITYPEDYGILKGQVKQCKQEAEEYRAKFLELEAQLEQERRGHLRERQGLELQLSKLKSRCEVITDVEAFLPEMMIRENASWEILIKWYSETMKAGAELSEIPVENLEKACSTYIPVKETKEFKAIEKNYEMAKQAREQKKQNPYIEISGKAKEVLGLGDGMLKKGEDINFIRDELSKQFQQNRLRIALTTENGNALLTLPFKAKEKYEGLEFSFLDSLKKYLEKLGLPYETQDYHGLLRFNVREAKTQKKKRLTGLILSGKEDILSRFGGKKEIVGLEIYE